MIKIANIKKEHKIFIFFFSLALLMWLSFLFFSHRAYVDENVHLRQINRFLKGDWEILPSLTTIPGYHVAMALIAEAIPHPTLNDIRLISLALSLGSLWVFFTIAKTLETKNPLAKTLQFIFLPVSFFFFPLIYTDIFALLLILLAFLLAQKKRYHWSALFSLAAVLVRQNDIVWALFIWVYGYVSANGLSFSRKTFMDYARSTIGYLLILAAFFVFIFLNHGIAIGDKVDHPLGFYMGNIYFFLAMAGFLLLPISFDSFTKLRPSRVGKIMILGAIIITLFSLMFLLFPPEIHQGNLPLHFLRNIILFYAYHQYAWIYVLAIFIGCVTIFSLKLKKEALLLLPFIVLCLAPSLLVEQRYAIVPFVFLLLLRPEKGRKTEFSLVLYFLFLTLGLMYMILKTPVFL